MARRGCCLLPTTRCCEAQLTCRADTAPAPAVLQAEPLAQASPLLWERQWRALRGSSSICRCDGNAQKFCAAAGELHWSAGVHTLGLAICTRQVAAQSGCVGWGTRSAGLGMPPCRPMVVACTVCRACGRRCVPCCGWLEGSASVTLCCAAVSGMRPAAQLAVPPPPTGTRGAEGRHHCVCQPGKLAAVVRNRRQQLSALPSACGSV